MLNICVCYNESRNLTGVSNIITKIANKNGIFLNICKYYSGVEMLFDVIDSNKHIDIFFMDIIIDGMNGIKIANELREKNLKAPIIFLTREYGFEAINVTPLHYFVKKDVSASKMENIFLNAVSKAEEKRKNIFTYKSGKKLGNVLYKKILFFEVKNRIINMHLTNGEVIKFYSTIKEIENKLKNSCFVRSHRSFIVNLENVNVLNGKEFIFSIGKVVPIGQKYKKSVKEEYKKFYCVK